MIQMPVEVVNVKKIQSHTSRDASETLAIESPLEIRLKFGNPAVTKNLSVTMRTPGHDHELASGFLFTEGVINNQRQIKSITESQASNDIVIELCDGEIPVLDRSSRNFVTTSSCGVCGKSDIDSIKTNSPFAQIHDALKINSALFHQLERKLMEQQAVFSKTGGLHASALFNTDGEFLMMREDVGRHNALDKVIGAALVNDSLPLSDKILLLSGRASFELIQKASMAGIRVVAAVGAPSSLAVSLANESGITLIGFLRKDQFNIYSGAHRINL